MDWLPYVSQINWLAVLLAFIATMAIGFDYRSNVLMPRTPQAEDSHDHH